PHVKVFQGQTLAELRSFFAYDAGFLGGVFLAAGDVDGDGLADVVTGAGAGAPGGHVEVFDGATGSERASFLALGAGQFLGASVGALDRDGDGRAEILVGDPLGLTAPDTTGQPRAVVRLFDGLTLAQLDSFFASEMPFAGALFVSGR